MHTYQTRSGIGEASSMPHQSGIVVGIICTCNSATQKDQQARKCVSCSCLWTMETTSKRIAAYSLFMRRSRSWGFSLLIRLEAKRTVFASFPARNDSGDRGEFEGGRIWKKNCTYNSLPTAKATQTPWRRAFRPQAPKCSIGKNTLTNIFINEIKHDCAEILQLTV